MRALISKSDMAGKFLVDLGFHPFNFQTGKVIHSDPDIEICVFESGAENMRPENPEKCSYFHIEILWLLGLGRQNVDMKITLLCILASTKYSCLHIIPPKILWPYFRSFQVGFSFDVLISINNNKY